jgi:delta11-fatty-acid desaturase
MASPPKETPVDDSGACRSVGAPSRARSPPPALNSAPKARFRDGSSYTLIHGRWINLSTFAPSHPGGPVALSLAAGRDGTILFEQSHPFTDRARLAALLDKHTAPPELAAELHQRWPRASSEAAAFDFRAAAAALKHGSSSGGGGGGSSSSRSAVDGFEASVKAIAKSYFEREAARRGVSLQEATKAPPERWAHFFALGTAFIALGLLPLIRGEWYALLSAPILCWFWMVNFWHDASHFAMSRDWRVNCVLTYIAPWFSSP